MIMDKQLTHFRYVCRRCQREHFQLIDKAAPEKTPIPRCCGRASDQAYKGVATLGLQA